MLLSELLSLSFERYRERTALRFIDRAWTYAQLDRTTNSLAFALSKAGVRRGDPVAALLPNGPELVWFYIACLRLGAIAVPLNTRLSGPELARNLLHCGTRLCIAQADLYPRLQAVREELRPVEKMIVTQSDRPLPGTEPLEGLLAEQPGAGPWTASDPLSPAAILYTSGSTALPKGVLHTQGSLGATVRNYVEAVGLAETDVVLGMLSMAHIFGIALQLLSPLCAGATVVVSPDHDPESVFELIKQHGVTHLYGLPAMFDALTRSRRPGRSVCASLRYCLAGGDALTPALRERAARILGAELYEGCGMTEVIPYCLNRPGLENRAGTIGPPSIGMQVRLVDPEGGEVPDGQVGEIQVKSEALMAAYWRDPEATSEVLVDAWFRTGDLGQRDDTGYIRFVGRRKEIIVRGGSNISPPEVEAVLSQHPAVREVAVVGKPDAQLGETVAAFIVPRPSIPLETGDLLGFAADRLALYKLPESIYVLDDLPRSATGKVQRKLLKERFAGDGKEGDIQALRSCSVVSIPVETAGGADGVATQGPV